MELWINIIFAWVALILSFLLIVIWALRLIYIKSKSEWIGRLNKSLRKRHKLIGITLIAVALIHGIFSSDTVFSFNWGTASWIVSILLGLSWLLRKKFNPRKWWMVTHRILTVAFVGLLVVHILNVGGFIIDDMITGRISQPQTVAAQESDTDEATDEPKVSESEYDALPNNSSDNGNGWQHEQNAQSETQDTADESTDSDTQQSSDTSTATYIDGTYTGTANGFRPDLTVEVVIEDGLIVNVEVTDHNEVNERFWGTPVEVIPERIVESQSTDVDTVSGATYTSNGIMDAVKDALSNAVSE